MDDLREANRLAKLVLEGQQRNYEVMQSLLRVLWCLMVATGGLLVVLVLKALP
jgi:hypothetical protein